MDQATTPTPSPKAPPTPHRPRRALKPVIPDTPATAEKLLKPAVPDHARAAFQTLIVHVHDDLGQDARVRAAIDVGRCFGAAIAGVQVTAMQDFLPYAGLEGIAVYQAAAEAIAARDERLRKAFEARLAGEHLTWTYTHLDADPAGALINQAKLADLAILSLPDWQAGPMRTLELLGNVAMASRVPTLAVPFDLTRFEPDGCAVIAWNGSFEAARAVKAALPMLRLAAKVTILTVEDNAQVVPSGEALQAYLQRHGVAASTRNLLAETRPPARVLRMWVDEHDCDYLVMGLYGHSRLRELLFSGVSRTTVLESRVPLFLAH